MKFNLIKLKSCRPTNAIILCAILLMASACSSTKPPYQTLYEANTAIKAAEQKIGPCPCEALTPAITAYEKAKVFNEKAQYNDARLAANQALTAAQEILRRYQ